MMKDLSQSVGACPFCRSTRYQTTETGHLVCEYGHQSQSFWQEEQDDNDTNLSLNPRLRRSKKHKSFAGPTSTLTPQWEEESLFFKKEIIRYGEVERFELFLAFQFLLKVQIERVSQACHLTEGTAERFKGLVVEIWRVYVTALGLDYDEEEALPINPTPTAVVVVSDVIALSTKEMNSQEQKLELLNLIDRDPDDECEEGRSSVAASRSASRTTTPISLGNESLEVISALFDQDENRDVVEAVSGEESQFDGPLTALMKEWNQDYFNIETPINRKGDNLSLPPTIAQTYANRSQKQERRDHQDQNRYPRSILKKTISTNNLIVIIYFGLLGVVEEEWGSAVLMADLVRMICQGVLPYHNTKRHIPKALMRILEGRKWDVLFKTKADPVPSTMALEELAMRMAYFLKAEVGYDLPPVRPRPLLRRFCMEFCIPFCFIPIIDNLYTFCLEMPLAYGQVSRLQKYSPPVLLQCCFIFFLKLHYPVDIFTSAGSLTSSATASSVDFPPIEQLVNIWSSNSTARFIDYRRITNEKFFPKDRMMEFMHFLTAVGILNAIDGDFEVVPPDYDIMLFDQYKIVNWMEKNLSQEQLSLLVGTRKNWTDSLQGRDLLLENTVEDLNDPIWDELPVAYACLLKRACLLMGCDMAHLLLTICRRFEHHSLFKVTKSLPSSRKSSRAPSRASTPVSTPTPQ